MKVLVRGNTVLVKTDINAEDFDKYQRYNAFVVKDEEGEETYRIAKHPVASIGKYALVCNTSVEGNLAASFVFEAEDEEAMAEVLDELKPDFLALKEAEENIKLSILAIEDRLAGLDELIVQG